MTVIDLTVTGMIPKPTDVIRDDDIRRSLRLPILLRTVVYLIAIHCQVSHTVTRTGIAIRMLLNTVAASVVDSGVQNVNPLSVARRDRTVGIVGDGDAVDVRS